MPDELNDLWDRLAELCGWQHRRCVCDLCKNLSDDEASGWVSDDPDCDGLSPAHPFPAGDLTTLAAAWPEGVGFTMHSSRGKCWMVAGEDVVEAPTEYEARLRLTVAVLTEVKCNG